MRSASVRGALAAGDVMPGEGLRPPVIFLSRHRMLPQPRHSNDRNRSALRAPEFQQVGGRQYLGRGQLHRPGALGADDPTHEHRQAYTSGLGCCLCDSAPWWICYDASMERTIGAMAAAILWVVKNETRIIEALQHDAEIHGRMPNEVESVNRLDVLRDTAAFLTRMMAHEEDVVALLENDLMAEFPGFSADTRYLSPGDRVLLLATLEQAMPAEVQVRVEAARISHSIPVHMQAIVGVERQK